MFQILTSGRVWCKFEGYQIYINLIFIPFHSNLSTWSLDGENVFTQSQFKDNRESDGVQSVLVKF